MRTRKSSNRLATAMRQSKIALNHPHQKSDAPSRLAPPFCAVLGYHRPERDTTDGSIVCRDCRKPLDAHNQPPD